MRISKTASAFNSKAKKFILFVLAFMFVLGSAATLAWFTDRAAHQMSFTTGVFTKDGYTFESKHYNGPFIAGEDVAIILTEDNEKEAPIDSKVTMSVGWTSPDGDTNATDGMTVTVKSGSEMKDVPVEPNADGGITFTLPTHTLDAKASDDTRTIQLHIPESLQSTGVISVTFDQVVIQEHPIGFAHEFDNATLNSGAEKHDFSVNVGWAASDKAVNTATNAHKAIMGYLTDDAKGIKFQFEFGYTTSGMKDFTSDDESKWSNYEDSITTLIFPESTEGTVTSIGDYDFAGFTKITELTLPENLTEVGAYAFDNISVSELTVPATVTVLKEMSFGHINELETITFNQATSTKVKFPEPGKDSGAFYVDPYVETEIITTQDAIQYGYTWANDQRRMIPMLDYSNYWQCRSYDIENNIYDCDLDYDKLKTIKIVDYYKPNGNEITWDASDPSVPGTVTAYLNQTGTMLTLAGNGYGSILANQDSSYAFWNLREVTTITGGQYLNMSKAVNCEGMFSDCMSLTSLDTSNWDMSNVKYMGGNEYASYGMFMWCENLSYIDVSQWNTGKVENMNRLFENSPLLDNLDVSGWDTSSLVYAENVFYGCEGLTYLDVSGWKMGNVITTNGMFTDCSGLSALDVSQWDVSNVEDMCYMFTDCSKLGSLNLAGWDVSSAVNMAQMFNGCTQLTSIGDTTNWNTINAEEMSYMFSSCSSLTSVSVKNWKMGKVESTMGMFMGCTMLNNVDVSQWNVSSVTNMQYMFRECVALTSLNVSNWTPTSLAYTEEMFDGCTLLNGIDVSGWQAPDLYYVRYMFRNCTSLTSIDISNWDLSSVSSAYDARGMFMGCTSLKSLTIPSSLKYLGIQFAANCPELQTIKFLHDADDILNYQAAGASTGAFFIDSYVDTVVVTESNHAKVTGYDWISDNRSLPMGSGGSASGSIMFGPGLFVTNPPDKTDYKSSENFDRSGMEVTYIDPNGVKHIVTDYTVPNGTDLDPHQTSVTISYDDGSDIYTTTVAITVVLSEPEWKDTNLIYNGNVQTPTWIDYDSDRVDISGDTSGTNAGTYTAIFTPKPGYTWSDGTTTPKEVTWAIGRATISTIPSQNGTLTYTGSAQSPSWSNYNTSQLSLGGTTSGTNATSYTAKFTPTSNYKWSDGSTTAKDVTWKIGKKSLTVPSQSGTLTYTGSTQSPTWANYSSGTMTLGGTTTGTNATSYTATFTLKDTANYQWSDDTTTAKNVTWTIGKASISTIPSQSNTLTYNGSAQSPTWANYNTSQLTIGGTQSGTNAASYTATFTPTSNYKWSDGSASKSATWTIGKASITTVPSQKNTLTYTGSAQSPTWNNYNTSQLTIGGTTTGTNATSYTATFTPTSNYKWSDGSASKSATWKIGKASVTVPSQSGSLTYTGSAQSPSWSNYDTGKMTLGGTTSGTNATSYTATFTLKSTSNYQWSDGTTAAKSVTWTIGKASISTVPSQKNTLTYTGSAQSPTWNNYNSSQLTIGGTQSGTNATSYTATFTPTSNYQWSGGSTAAKSVTWTIGKASITTVPSQKNTLTYTGSAQSPTWNNYNTSQLTIGGTTTGTNATSYTATFTPTSNYKWSDGSASKSATWKIGKASVTVPSQSGSLTYTGSAQSPSWSNYDTGKMTIGGTQSGTNATSYTATFTLKSTSNYQWSDGTTAAKSVTWKIGKASISTVPSQKNTLTYTGSAQSPTWNNYNTSQLTIGGTTTGTNATSYTATFTPTSNYKWSDGSASKSATWKIGKASVTVPSQSGSLSYTGSAQSPSWSNYNTNLMTIGGTQSGTNATSYTATFTLKSTSNSQWSDGTTAAKSVTWKIGKKSLTVPSPSGIVAYTGNYVSPTWNNYDTTAMRDAGVTSAKTPGTRTATFVLLDTTNCQWSDGTTANKNVNWTIAYMWYKYDIQLVWEKGFTETTTKYVYVQSGMDLLQKKTDEIHMGSQGDKITRYSNFSLSDGLSGGKTLTIEHRLFDENVYSGYYYYKEKETIYINDELYYSGPIVYYPQYVSHLNNTHLVAHANHGYYIQVDGPGTTNYGTVTSASESAYPKNGEQDGYWYVRADVAAAAASEISDISVLSEGDTIIGMETE